MIELRLLGSPELRTPDGNAVTSVLAQPKRFALLVYLVVGGAGGFVRRDRLLAMFWPESDAERARAALRQAIRYLRRSLGDDVVVGRGEDELGIAEGRIECDVLALRRSLDSEDWERVVASYGGELLPGFHVPDSPDFDAWLDSERAALRAAAVRATGTLRGRAFGAGDLVEAIRWARRATVLEPLSEAASRALMSLFGHSGDRPAAVAEFERLRARLSAELDLSPSRETASALDEAIRTSASLPVFEASGRGARVTAPVGGEPNAEATSVAAPGPAERHPGRRGFATGRRRSVAALAVLAITVAIAALTTHPAPGIFRSGGDDPHRLEPRRVLVAPFANHTLDAGLEPLSRMAADWITDGISWTHHLEVVPLTSILAVERHVADTNEGPEPRANDSAALRLARETGAGVLVSGAYYLDGDELLFRAQVLDVASGRILRPVETVSAPAILPMQGIADLRTRVLASLATLGDTVYHLRAAAQPPTYEAYREYLLGMDRFVASRDPAGALQHYLRAAAADTRYAMPRLAAAIMQMNLGEFLLADSLASEVASFGTELGPLEQGTLQFVVGMLRGDFGAAYAAMVPLAAIAPGTINEFMVAELARRRNRPREALRVLDRMGPDRGELRGWRIYWREATFAAHMLGDHRRELRDVRRARARDPDDPALTVYEVAALAALGRTREVDARIEAAVQMRGDAGFSPGELMRIAGDEYRAHGRASAAAAMFERSVAWHEARPDAIRATRSGAIAYAEVLSRVGRPADARAVLAPLVEQAPADLELLGWAGIHAARAGDRTEAERISRRLDEHVVLSGRTGPISDPWGGHLRARATIEAQLGRPQAAVELLRRAHDAGMSFDPSLHRDPHLEPLHGHPEFERWLAPRG
jgi:DNA-binding SARP family transcriptional activator